MGYVCTFQVARPEGNRSAERQQYCAVLCVSLYVEPIRLHPRNWLNNTTNLRSGTSDIGFQW